MPSKDPIRMGVADTAGLPGELRIALHREMVRLRLLEERIAERYPDQEMRCPVHLSIGQEAVAAGVCGALAPRDLALSAHRSHGHYLSKGGDMGALVAELYGRATGCAGGKGGSMHLVDLGAGFVAATPIVGSTIAIGVGVALAAAMRGEDTVTVVFHGEAATEEGVFHEAILFAALRRLPVVFVCENNLYSVYSPMAVRQGADRDIVAIARANGLLATRGDGNDVEAVYRLARMAVDHARSGAGPVLLELETYRWLEHCGPNYDNHLPYREESEFEAWRERDPLMLHRLALETGGIADAAAIASMTEVASSEVDAAFAFALQSPAPGPEAFLSNVHAEVSGS